MPDRYNNQKHDSKLDYTLYGACNYSSEFWLWHDIGVSVKGSVVKDMEIDFVKR